MSSTAYFSPNGGAEAALIAAIDAAEIGVFGLLNMYQSGPIHEALLAAQIRVGGSIFIFDKRMLFQQKQRFIELLDAGALLYYDIFEKQIHSQYIIIDSYLVFSGSYLYTYTSETRYADNLIKFDDTDLYVQFAANFFYHMDHARPIIFP